VQDRHGRERGGMGQGLPVGQQAGMTDRKHLLVNSNLWSMLRGLGGRHPQHLHVKVQ